MHALAVYEQLYITYHRFIEKQHAATCPKWHELSFGTNFQVLAPLAPNNEGVLAGKQGVLAPIFIQAAGRINLVTRFCMYSGYSHISAEWKKCFLRNHIT